MELEGDRYMGVRAGLLTRPLLVPYAYVAIESIECILL